MDIKKGSIQLFYIDRIEQKNNTSYYVITVKDKEAWVRMYPFEEQKNKKTQFIRCKYCGTDIYNSPILERYKMDILNELYEEGMVCKFTYLKDNVDYNKTPYSLLLDEYGLYHRLYEDLSPEQKSKQQIECKIDSINEERQILELSIFNSQPSEPQIIQNYLSLFKRILVEFNNNNDGVITSTMEIEPNIGEKYISLYKLQGLVQLLKAVHEKESVKDDVLLKGSSTYSLLPQIGKMILAYRLIDENTTQKEILIPIKNLIYNYVQSASNPLITELTDLIKQITQSISTNYPKVSKIIEKVENEAFEESNDINNKTIYWNLYNNNNYEITTAQPKGNNIIYTIPIPEQESPSGFLLLCYNNGSINKISIKILLSKKRNYRYTTGSYPNAKLIGVYPIATDSYILIESQYDNKSYIKIYHTSKISTHYGFHLKGNQVVGIIDNVRYKVIPENLSEKLPTKLIYHSAIPKGKCINQKYYQKEFNTLEKLGLLQFSK